MHAECDAIWLVRQLPETLTLRRSAFTELEVTLTDSETAAVASAVFNNAGSRPSNPISFLLPCAILNARKWCARGLVIFVPVLARLLFPGGMFCAPYPGPLVFCRPYDGGARRFVH